MATIALGAALLQRGTAQRRVWPCCSAGCALPGGWPGGCPSNWRAQCSSGWQRLERVSERVGVARQSAPRVSRRWRGTAMHAQRLGTAWSANDLRVSALTQAQWQHSGGVCVFSRQCVQAPCVGRPCGCALLRCPGAWLGMPVVLPAPVSTHCTSAWNGVCCSCRWRALCIWRCSRQVVVVVAAVCDAGAGWLLLGRVGLWLALMLHVVAAVVLSADVLALPGVFWARLPL